MFYVYLSCNYPKNVKAEQLLSIISTITSEMFFGILVKVQMCVSASYDNLLGDII